MIAQQGLEVEHSNYTKIDIKCNFIWINSHFIPRGSDRRYAYYCWIKGEAKYLEFNVCHIFIDFGKHLGINGWIKLSLNYFLLKELRVEVAKYVYSVICGSINVQPGKKGEGIVLSLRHGKICRRKEEKSWVCSLRLKNGMTSAPSQGWRKRVQPAPNPSKFYSFEEFWTPSKCQCSSIHISQYD